MLLACVVAVQVGVLGYDFVTSRTNAVSLTTPATRELRDVMEHTHVDNDMDAYKDEKAAVIGKGFVRAGSSNKSAKATRYLKPKDPGPTDWLAAIDDFASKTKEGFS